MTTGKEELLDWLKTRVNIFLKPLMVDLLKDKPECPLDFMIFWLQTMGKKIEKSQNGGKDGSQKRKESDYLPHSDPDNDIEEEHLPAYKEPKKSEIKKKLGISAEAYGEYNKLIDFVPRIVAKTEEQLNQIRSRLKDNFMFKCLEEKALKIVIGAMEIKQFKKDEKVITQGNDGQELYIVYSGSLRCTKTVNEEKEPIFLKNYVSGDVFGELSLLYNTPRAANIIATEASICFSLDRDTFNNIVKTASIKNRQLFDDFLLKVEILKDLDSYERVKLCDCLEKEVFKKGDFIIKEGDQGDKFYLIQEGKAEAIKVKADGSVETVFKYQENDYFGELALLNDDVRMASIKVVSDVMVVASMSKYAFKRLLGPIEAILKRNSEKYAKYFKQNV